MKSPLMLKKKKGEPITFVFYSFFFFWYVVPYIKDYVLHHRCNQCCNYLQCSCVLEALLLVSSFANVTFGYSHFTHFILQKCSIPNVSRLSQQQSRACCGAHTLSHLDAYTKHFL